MEILLSLVNPKRIFTFMTEKMLMFGIEAVHTSVGRGHDQGPSPGTTLGVSALSHRSFELSVSICGLSLFIDASVSKMCP